MHDIDFLLMSGWLVSLFTRRPRMPISRLIFGYLATSAERMNMFQNSIARFIAYIRSPMLLWRVFFLTWCRAFLVERLDQPPPEEYIRQYNKVTKSSSLHLDDLEFYGNIAPVNNELKLSGDEIVRSPIQSPPPIHPTFVNSLHISPSLPSPPAVSAGNPLATFTSNDNSSQQQPINNRIIELPPLPTASISPSKPALDTVDIHDLFSKINILSESLKSKTVLSK